MSTDSSIEKQTIACLKQGDERAFIKLYHTYSPILLSFLTSLSIQEDQKADCIQQVFLKIWENRENINTELSFKNYLFTIAKNDISNSIRRQIIANRHIEYIERNNIHSEIPKSNELQEILSQILNYLPEKRRRVFEMSRVEGFSNQEIAEKLNISKSTVENHINNSSSFIKKLLKNFGYTLTTFFILF